MATKITTHVTDAQKRLFFQYKNKPGFKGTIKAFVEQLQELEDVCWDLIEKRSLDTAEGEQLDNIGRIVLLDRPQGLSDSKYRLRLKVRIIIIISNGEPETLIQIFKLMTSAVNIRFRELPNAAAVLYSEVTPPAEEVDLIFEFLEAGAVGGVRIQEIGIFDETTPFVTQGALFGEGFASIVGPVSGGKLGTILRPTSPFAFSGGAGTKGFGTVIEPLIGGILGTI